MIGVFDSGFGGLVILREILKQLPEYSSVYLGDNARAPYGNRSTEEIYQFTRQAVEKLFTEGCELVILACNSASANALRRIQRDDLPRFPGKKVLGILVPTVEQITGVSWLGGESLAMPIHIAVFATTATVHSHAYQREILRRNPQALVFEIACPQLVTLIEAGADEGQLRSYVEECVAELKRQILQPDAVLLGCTHYPLVFEYFSAALPGIPIFDQAMIVAKSLRLYLERHPEIEQKLDRTRVRRFLTTAETSTVEPMASAFLGGDARYEMVVLS